MHTSCLVSDMEARVGDAAAYFADCSMIVCVRMVYASAGLICADQKAGVLLLMFCGTSQLVLVFLRLPGGCCISNAVRRHEGIAERIYLESRVFGFYAVLKS